MADFAAAVRGAAAVSGRSKTIGGTSGTTPTFLRSGVDVRGRPDARGRVDGRDCRRGARRGVAPPGGARGWSGASDQLRNFVWRPRSRQPLRDARLWHQGGPRRGRADVSGRRKRRARRGAVRCGRAPCGFASGEAIPGERRRSLTDGGGARPTRSPAAGGRLRGPSRPARRRRPRRPAGAPHRGALESGGPMRRFPRLGVLRCTPGPGPGGRGGPGVPTRGSRNSTCATRHCESAARSCLTSF